MSQRESLEVRMDDRLVGTLALTANHKVAFSYSEEWLEHGFSVSPFSLPLKNEVFVPKKDYFDGLFGVFADSLPDAWGQHIHFHKSIASGILIIRIQLPITITIQCERNL